MKVFFLLSGEHKTLPMAEVLAGLESMGASFKVLDFLEQVLVLETDRLDDIHERLAMCHKVCEFLGGCGNDFHEILDSISQAHIKFKGSFAVRIRRIREYAPKIKATDLERKVGEIIKGRTGMEVDLFNPANVIYGVLSDKFIYGRVLREVDRSQYEVRRPHLRPYFRPGAMLPRTSRAVVNLTRIKKGGRFLDPFCGAGGFLIEAGLMGAEVYGYDIDEDAVRGCRRNLNHFGVKGYQLEVGDARDLKDKYRDFFDAIAADLPYGIQSSTRGMTLEELYKKSLESFFGILKEGGYACIISPEHVVVEALAQEAGFEVVETHSERIHRSLTRKILVIRK
jgi:tRNA (guanine10-N2)-dimethyltransferase